MTKCPYCGKELVADERYCFHCENDLSKLVNKEQKPKCFIATAAYGNSFVKEVQILRNFRDKKLKNNFLGLLFIKFYYKISPPIAKIIEKNEFIKKIVRVSLKPVTKIILKIK
jgi:predicted amidophosphoribosyltransferase